MEPKPIEQGFSADGYITNQDCFHSLRYRTMPADINGCGWIAACNLRRFLGHDDGRFRPRASARRYEDRFYGGLIFF